MKEPGWLAALPLVGLGVEIVKSATGLHEQVKATIEDDADVTELGFAFIRELNENADMYAGQIAAMLAAFTDKGADWFLDEANVSLADFMALLEGAASVVPFEFYMRLFNRIMTRFNSLTPTPAPCSDSDADIAAPTLTDSESTEPSDSASE